MKASKERLDELQSGRKKILHYILSTLRDHTKNSMEKAWALLDQRKIGLFELPDFRQALIGLGLYITKQEMQQAFNFIDANQDGVASFFEFADCWDAGEFAVEPVSMPQGSESAGGGDNELHQLEEDLLEHLSKVVNQREISLWDAFNETDQQQKGVLDAKQFSAFLMRLGVSVDNEGKLERMMRIIDPKSQGRMVLFSAIEARLAGRGLSPIISSAVERVSWHDHAVGRVVAALRGLLRK